MPAEKCGNALAVNGACYRCDPIPVTAPPESDW